MLTFYTVLPIKKKVAKKLYKRYNFTILSAFLSFYANFLYRFTDKKSNSVLELLFVLDRIYCFKLCVNGAEDEKNGGDLVRNYPL